MTPSENEVVLFDVELAEAEGYKGFLIDANDGIRIYGYDVRMEFKT